MPKLVEVRGDLDLGLVSAEVTEKIWCDSLVTCLSIITYGTFSTPYSYIQPLEGEPVSLLTGANLGRNNTASVEKNLGFGVGKEIEDEVGLCRLRFSSS